MIGKLWGDGNAWHGCEMDDIYEEGRASNALAYICITPKETLELAFRKPYFT